MAFSWFKTRRRRALLEEPFPAAWREYLAANMRHYAYLQPHEQALVETVVRVVVAEIHWFGGPRFDVTEEMKVTVAAQASLLVLGFEEPYFFDRLQSIILYPGVYMHPRQLRRYTGLTARLLGEAWYHSPIVLSWRAVLTAGRDEADGHNVVLHEFAHYLDGLDGSIDGTPPLEDRDQETAWYQVTETEYRRLVGQARRGEQALLDHYGATNRAEFFAVITECFFERPQALRREHKALYGALHDFYRQDPAQWLPDAQTARPETDRPEADLPAAGGGSASDIAKSDDADAMFTLAVDASRREDYVLAERAASRAIELDPSDVEAYQQRAAARVKLGRFAAALADCRTVLGLDDRDTDTYRIRAEAYLGLGKYRQAKADLDRVLRESRHDAEAYCLRATALEHLDQLDAAVSDLSKAVVNDPYSARAYRQRSLAYRRLGRTAEAEADHEAARRFDLDGGGA